jgi:hypothetical protein
VRPFGIKCGFTLERGVLGFNAKEYALLATESISNDKFGFKKAFTCLHSDFSCFIYQCILIL